MMSKDWIFKRGDLYLADLGPPRGSAQGGTRPIVILQNEKANYYSPTVTHAPLTSNIEKKKRQPTHCLIRRAPGLSRPSMVLAEQIDTLDKKNIIRYLGRVDAEQMRKIDEAVRVHLGYYVPQYVTTGIDRRERRLRRRHRRKAARLVQGQKKRADAYASGSGSVSTQQRRKEG